MRKSDLESQIIDSKVENLRFKRALELLEGAQYNNPFKPSEHDVEVWEKYGERWPDPKMIKKYGQTFQRSWKRLNWRDWINFYKWLIQWKNISIERLELEMEKITKKEKSKEDKVIKYIHQFIEIFAKYFSEDTEYSREAIETYITEWHSRDGIPNKRAKAKKAAIKKCEKLEPVQDGTLTNWEEKWTEFHNTRTAK